VMSVRGAGRSFSSLAQFRPQELTRRGAGGRSSASGIQACVFGATGFYGRYVVNELGRMGTQVMTPYRCPEMQMRHLKPAGDLGQIIPVQFDPFEYESIKEMVAGCDVVINLIGKRYETTFWSFNAVHCDLAEAIAMACAEEGVEQLIHMSALGAAVDSPSAFMQSKALGEAAVKNAFPTATIMRPAPTVGSEDSYFNFLARLTKLPGPLSGTFPLIDGGSNQQQPVTAVNVAQAVAAAANTTGSLGQTYELAGPRAYTQDELADVMFESMKVSQGQRSTMAVPKSALKFLIGTTGLRLPLINQIPLTTEDMVERLSMEITPSEDSLGLLDLGVEPQSIEKHLDFMEAYCSGGARQTFLM